MDVEGISLPRHMIQDERDFFHRCWEAGITLFGDIVM